MSKKGQPSEYLQAPPRRFSRHQNKKTKKPDEEKDHKQLLEYIVKPEVQVLQRIYNSQQEQFPGHFKLGIWRKNISLLTRSHLPLYVKLLDYVQLNQSVLVPSKAHINPKKNNKTDILIEDPITQKTRLIKMQTFPILLTPQRLIFYKFTLSQFQRVFQSTQYSSEDIKKVFNYFVQQLQLNQNGNYLLWPSVIIEGLNYKFEQIQQIISNFKVSNSQSINLFQNILKIVNQNLSQNISQQQKSIINQQDDINKQNINFEEGAAPIFYQNQQKNAQLNQANQNNQEQIKQQNQQIKTQNKFCIWHIGTSSFSFANSNIVRWGDLSSQLIKSLFSSSLYSGLIKQTNSLIDSLNKHKKLQQAQLKADEYKFFLYRIGTYKSEQQQSLCIPLRFEYVKGTGKRILIKILRKSGTQLKWVPIQTTTANYNLPNISKKQMNFLYLSKKLSPLDIITAFFYRQFLYLPQRETSQVFRVFYPQFYTNQEQAYRQRCRSCNYLIRDMPFKCCFFCQSFSHQQCTGQIRRRLTNSFTQQLFPNLEQIPWICQKCQPCTICSQAVGEDFLFCSTCFIYSHFQCGRIKGLQNQSKMQHLKINDKYICQFCLKCKMCSHKLKDNEYLIMDNQFYCSECSDKIKSNNHCHVCMKKKQGNSSMKWIQCGNNTCQKWVHQICDPEYIAIVKCPSASDQYLCPFCRISEKRKIYVQIINSLTVFDEAQFFTQPTYKTIPFYDTIISEPMCFSVMKQKALAGQYDDNPFKRLNSDFQLIVSNALKFNMPKQLAHVQAKILKIMGEKTLEKYKHLFNTQLKSLISGSAFQQIKNLKLQLHRQINNHYPEILLNYKAQKSIIQIKQTKKKVNQLKPQDQIKFSSTFILNNLFRNSTIIFHLKKQKIGINNLFTMPKSQNQRGIWHSIKGDLCYYHDNSDIIYSCNQCCQSYCCMKECIRHRVCTSCGQKGCKCDSYECGCLPLKQKEKKIIEAKLLRNVQPTRTSRQALMDLTQNFKYCLKCAQDKVPSRICTACNSLCSWGYFKCPDCSRVWHKKCYPYSLSTSYVASSSNALSKSQSMQASQQPAASLNLISQASLSQSRPSTQSNKLQNLTCSTIYCKDCLSQNHVNNYQQSLTLQSKSRLIKISKITRYMRIFIEVYFNQGIRLTPYQIQQLILDNYDQFSIRQQLFKQYQLNYAIIERFRDFSFKTNAAIQRSCDQYLNDYLQIKKSIYLQNHADIREALDLFAKSNQSLSETKWLDRNQFNMRCRSIWWKYCKKLTLQYQQEDTPLLTFQNKFCKLYVEKISQMRQNLILQAYTYKDYNSFILQKAHNKQNILKSLKFENLNNPVQSKMQDVYPSFSQQQTNFLTQKQYRNYLQSLSYVSTMQQSYYKKQHHYRYTLIYLPRAMPFEYKLVPTFKKKSNLQTATKQFLLGIYQQNKYCLRKGSTCILRQNNSQKDSKDYWRVLKRWAKGKKQMLITLQKKSDRWYLKIDNQYQRIVHEIQEIMNQINRRNPQIKINSFKQLGQFLGFTIFEPFYKANHFTNFLQTNLVDQMPLLEKMNKISQLYTSFTWKENGIFVKPGPSIHTSSLIVDPTAVPKIIDYEYCMNKIKPLYLTKKPKKNLDKAIKKMQKRVSATGDIQLPNTSQIETSSRKQSFVTFEDLKRYLLDYTVPNPVKLDISLKNNTISNQVFIAPSKIHKLGLFSRKFIKKHTIIIEYVGQIVSQSVADLREKRFHYGCYLFGILKQPNKQNQDKKDIIDATFRGNMARYLNHSCDPNCKAKTEYINGLPRIIIYTIRDIQQFEQITYDYQFNVDAVQKLECTCGAKNCQGRLN